MELQSDGEWADYDDGGAAGVHCEVLLPGSKERYTMIPWEYEGMGTDIWGRIRMSGERASEFWTLWIGMGFLGLLDIHREHAVTRRAKQGLLFYSLVSALSGTIASMCTNTISSLWISRRMDCMDNERIDSIEMIPRCECPCQRVRVFEMLSHIGMCFPIPRNTDCTDTTQQLTGDCILSSLLAFLIVSCLCLQSVLNRIGTLFSVLNRAS
jgi:hypothetical protein